VDVGAHAISVAERARRRVAQLLLNSWVMRPTTAASTNPWGTSIDDGWKDLVVSSAPPPPPPTPRDAVAADPVVRNRPLPADINTWQEHGAPRTAPVVDEPSFSAGDRRLWVIAGTLMGLAAIVLGLLGALTFGAFSPSPSSPSEPAAVATEAPRAVDSPRAVEPVRAPGVVVTHSSNPRVLKAAAHTNRGRHHKSKKIAER
jgi:hypothetical protein